MFASIVPFSDPVTLFGNKEIKNKMPQSSLKSTFLTLKKKLGRTIKKMGFNFTLCALFFSLEKNLLEKFYLKKLALKKNQFKKSYSKKSFIKDILLIHIIKYNDKKSELKSKFLIYLCYILVF